MQDNGWDDALKVTGDGAGLVGHAGAVLLRKAADQAGLGAGQVQVGLPPVGLVLEQRQVAGLGSAAASNWRRWPSSSRPAASG
jgi:hypothetical protein